MACLGLIGGLACGFSGGGGDACLAAYDVHTVKGVNLLLTCIYTAWGCRRSRLFY